MIIKLRRGVKEFKCPSCNETIEIEHGRFASNSKGSGFEAWVAKEISYSMYGDLTTICRSPCSGAIASRWPFDLYPPKIGENNFPLGVECKFRNGWQLEDLLYRKQSKPSRGKRKADTFLLDFWLNTISDSKKHNKIPILIIKKNREAPLTIFNPSDFKDSKFENVIIFTDCWVTSFESFKKTLLEKYGRDLEAHNL